MPSSCEQSIFGSKCRLPSVSTCYESIQPSRPHRYCAISSRLPSASTDFLTVFQPIGVRGKAETSLRGIGFTICMLALPFRAWEAVNVQVVPR